MGDTRKRLIATKAGTKNVKSLLQILDKFTVKVEDITFKSLAHKDFKTLVKLNELRGGDLSESLHDTYVSACGKVLTVTPGDFTTVYYSLTNSYSKQNVDTTTTTRRNNVTIKGKAITAAQLVAHGFTNTKQMIDLNKYLDRYVSQLDSMPDVTDGEAQTQLGRSLQTHHINGDEGDDRPCNLLILTAQEHGRVHRALNKSAVTQAELSKVVRELRKVDVGYRVILLTNLQNLRYWLKIKGLALTNRQTVGLRHDLISIFDTSVLGSQNDSVYDEGVAHEFTVIHYLTAYHILRRTKTADEAYAILKKYDDTNIAGRFIDEVMCNLGLAGDDLPSAYMLQFEDEVDNKGLEIDTVAV